MRRSNSARAVAGGGEALSQSARGAAPRVPASRQARQDVVRDLEGRRIPVSALRAPAISSSPSGEPCAALVPALVGAPKPMVVLAAISVGRSDFCAVSMAAAMASGSWPSIWMAFQPEALKRATWSVESDSETGPSIEMLLLSQKTISLLSFRWPASEIASWLMPSIRQPSPQIT